MTQQKLHLICACALFIISPKLTIAQPPAADTSTTVNDSETPKGKEAKEAEAPEIKKETVENDSAPETENPAEHAGLAAPAAPAQENDNPPASSEAPEQPTTPVPPVTPPTPPKEIVSTVEEDPPVEERRSLLPEGEKETMGKHAVDSTDIQFVPGKGLEVTSADKRFRLQIRARVQFRWTAAGDGDGFQHQFRIRRARLVASGYTFSKNVKYKMELAVSPNDVGIKDNLGGGDGANPARSPLLDFYVQFKHLRDLNVRMGQYKVPSNRQRVISSGNLQLVDRSLLNSEFTLDRDVGLDIRSKDFLGLDMLKYYAGVFIARGRDSQGFDDFGLMYLARVEFLPLGIFKDDYSETDFDRGKPRLSIGAQYAHIDRATRDRGIRGSAPVDGGTTDMHTIFADAMFKWAGFSTQVEFAYRTGSRNPGDAVDEMGNLIPAAATRDGYALMLQAGYLIPRLPLEFAARYGIVRGTGAETALSDNNELVLGASWYPGRHPYKVQLDYSRLWGDSIGNGSNRIRLQIQVSL